MLLLITPGATALHLTPWKEFSNAALLTNMLTMAMLVEYIVWPGWGVSPAAEDKTTIDPLVSLRKGVARDIN